MSIFWGHLYQAAGLLTFDLSQGVKPLWNALSMAVVLILIGRLNAGIV